MSYNDDEEFKMGDFEEEDDGLEVDHPLDAPLDGAEAHDDEPLDEGLADLDGSSY